jgi:hypothetical protein
MKDNLPGRRLRHPARPAVMVNTSKNSLIYSEYSDDGWQIVAGKFDWRELWTTSITIR